MTIEKIQELSEKWLRKRIDDRTLEKLLLKIVEIAKNTNSIEELNIVLDMNNKAFYESTSIHIWYFTKP